MLTPDEIERAAENDGGVVAETPPTLEHFRESIDRYNDIAAKVLQVPTPNTFDHWFQVDIKAFKAALHNTVKKWSLVLIDHLRNRVVTSLQDLDVFIKEANTGLAREVAGNDYTALVEVMKFLNALDARKASTDGLFQPLVDTVALLQVRQAPAPRSVPRGVRVCVKLLPVKQTHPPCW
jgi:hypothetical protein